MSGRRRELWGGHRAWLLALALLVLRADALGAQAARLEVRDIHWEGNERFSSRALAAAIVTRESSCRSWLLGPLCELGIDRAFVRRYFEPREFRRDVTRLDLFYYLRGYRDAAVDTVVTRSADGVEITFQVREAEPIVVEELRVVGGDTLVDDALTRSLPLRQGRPFSTIDLEAARDTLLRRLRNRGFFYADVLASYVIPEESPLTADVTFELVPGSLSFFGPVTVDGERAVSESVVRRMLPFREGDRYQEDGVFQGQRNLYNLQIFTHASIEPAEPAALDSVIPHVVRVNEGDAHRMRGGAGMNTADCLSAETRWTSRNFLGGARNLQLRARVSNVLAQRLSETLCTQSGTGDYGRLNWLASAEFTQPWLFSPRNSFSLALYAERQSLPDVFVRQAYGANVSVVRTIGRRSLLNLSYRPQLAKLDAAEIFFCTSFEVCAPRDIADLQAANWLTPAGLAVSRDRTNQVFAPTAGYTVLVDFEHASALTRSQYAYNRIIGDYTRYQGLWPGWVIAARLRPGVLLPRPFGRLSPAAGDVAVVHPQKRFYAGGPNSVRGFAQNQLGPRVLTVDAARLVRGEDSARCTPQEIEALTCDPDPFPQSAFVSRPIGGSAVVEGSVELRLPVYGSVLRAAAFLDFGQVWRDVDEVRLGELELAPGLGLRYFTPVGPIRVDVGYRSTGVQSLPVVTTKLRPYDALHGDEEKDIVVTTADGLAWVRSNELAPLERPKDWHRGRSFFDRLQIHFAIGQAF
ncbi:MAG: BamA/TamA family outer membrane protein [Gemmatimonadetes bacterium]|nr:BamA/TamA family outer membrane protein [Gemmatimonadota bacterium]